MKKTLREKYIAGLLVLGYSKVASASLKFELFANPDLPLPFAYVGKSGSLRFSTQKRFDSSVPASDRTKAMVISKGESA